MSSPDAPRRAPLRTRTAASVALLALAAVAVGCWSSRAGDDAGSSRFADDPVTVRVENQNWNTVHVYVVAGGQFQSLGQISSQSSASYEVSATLLGGRKEIRLMADPVGSRESFLTDPILIEPGDLVEWTLTQPLVHSGIMVR